MFDPNDIKDLQYSTEKQVVDRKSARIAAKDSLGQWFVL